jgi:hypothetical protein
MRVATAQGESIATVAEELSLISPRCNVKIGGTQNSIQYKQNGHSFLLRVAVLTPDLPGEMSS